MGAAGTDVALDTADVALMSDDLDRLPGRDRAGARRRCRRHAPERHRVAARSRASFVVLAPLGLVTLVLAVAADMGMSLLVTLNALRLLRGGRDVDAAATLAAAMQNREVGASPTRSSPL